VLVNVAVRHNLNEKFFSKNRGTRAKNGDNITVYNVYSVPQASGTIWDNWNGDLREKKVGQWDRSLYFRFAILDFGKPSRFVEVKSASFQGRMARKRPPFRTAFFRTCCGF